MQRWWVVTTGIRRPRAKQLWYQNDQRRRANLNYIYLGGSLVATREVVGSAQTLKYQHTDALGTPIAVTGANKALVQTSEYEPYGQLLNRTLTDGPGFTGHVLDAATGLTYMQQRYCDQGIGRFLSTDPVTAYAKPGVNFNRYWYADNNPYKFTDPDGRESGAGYATGEYQMAQPQCDSSCLGTIADFTPIIGDIKGFVDAYNDPSVINIAAAVIGLVPEVGDAVGKGMKEAVTVADAAKSGRRIGDFTRGQKNAAKAENAAKNGGKMACTDCGKSLQNVKSEKGVPTPSNQAQVHHDPAIKNGGGQHSQPIVVCPECHKERHAND